MRSDGFQEFRGRIDLTDPEAALTARAAARAYCLENGCDIGRLWFQQNANRAVVINKYGCTNCDVEVELSYPE